MELYPCIHQKWALKIFLLQMCDSGQDESGIGLLLSKSRSGTSTASVADTATASAGAAADNAGAGAGAAPAAVKNSSEVNPFVLEALHSYMHGESFESAVRTSDDALCQAFASYVPLSGTATRQQMEAFHHFQQMVEPLVAAKVEAMGVSAEQFVEAARRRQQGQEAGPPGSADETLQAVLEECTQLSDYDAFATRLRALARAQNGLPSDSAEDDAGSAGYYTYGERLAFDEDAGHEFKGGADWQLRRQNMPKYLVAFLNR